MASLARSNGLARLLRWKTHLSNSGVIRSCFLRFEIVFWSATLKNEGATRHRAERVLVPIGSETEVQKRDSPSVNHFGSIAVTSRMYSLEVRTSSWYTHHSGARLNSDDEGWRKTGVLRVSRIENKGSAS